MYSLVSQRGDTSKGRAGGLNLILGCGRKRPQKSQCLLVPFSLSADNLLTLILLNDLMMSGSLAPGGCSKSIAWHFRDKDLDGEFQLLSIVSLGTPLGHSGVFSTVQP